MPTPRRARRTKAQWQATIEAQASSEMDISDYCHTHDIPITSFRKWQRILGRNESTNIPRFIELPKPVEPEVDLRTTHRIELDLGNGMTLKVYN